MRTIASLMGAAVVVLAVARLSEAWPAIQDPVGVHLCDSRPAPLPGGRWACRSGGVVYEGYLVDVSRGPAGPPASQPGLAPPGRSFPPYPGWPPRGGSGYDELDPWLRQSDR